jgi:hypothetical protein
MRSLWQMYWRFDLIRNYTTIEQAVRQDSGGLPKSKLQEAIAYIRPPCLHQ